MRARTLVLILAALALSTASFAAYGYISFLFEDFEDVSPPALPPGWTTLNANGDAAEWVTRSYGGVTWGRNCIRYRNNPGQQADDWFFTSGAGLEMDEYIVKFMYRCSSGGHPEALSVWGGSAPDPGSMTFPVWSDPAIINTDYMEAEGTLGPLPAPGTYYLGFHVESPAGTGNLYVDDVSLSEYVSDIEPGLKLRGGMTRELYGPPVYAPDDTIMIYVYIENTGTDTPIVNKRFTVGQEPTDTELEFIINGPGGPLPYVNMYSKAGFPDAGDFVPLYPDSIVGKIVDLWNWFEFDVPGQYDIVLHYRNYSDPGVGAWKGELFTDMVADPISIVIE